MDFETIHKIHILGLEDIVIRYVKKNVSKEDYDKILKDYSEYSFVTSILMSAIHHQRDLVNKFLSLSVMEYIPYLKSIKIKKNTKREIPTKSKIVEAKRVKTEVLTTQCSVKTLESPKPFHLIKEDPYDGNTFLKPRYCKYLNIWQIKTLKSYAEKYYMLRDVDVEIIVAQLNSPKYKNKTNKKSVEMWLVVNEVALGRYENLDMSKFDIIEAPKPKKIMARKKSIYTNWQLRTLQKYHRECQMPSLEMCHVITVQLNSPKYENHEYSLDVGDIYKYFKQKKWRVAFESNKSHIKAVEPTDVSTEKWVKELDGVNHFTVARVKDESVFSASQILCMTLCADGSERIPKEDVMLCLSDEINVPLGKVKRWMINYFTVVTY